MTVKRVGLYRRRRLRLIRRLSGSAEMLQGSLVQRYVKCGKVNCHCANDQGHGPMFYLSFKEKGQTKVIYVPGEEVQKVRQQLASFKQYKEIGREIAKLNREILKLRKGRR